MKVTCVKTVGDRLMSQNSNSAGSIRNFLVCLFVCFDKKNVLACGVPHVRHEYFFLVQPITLIIVALTLRYIAHQGSLLRQE